MRAWNIAAVFAAGVIAGCMAGGSQLQARVPEDVPVEQAHPAGGPPTVLLLDRTDLRIGTTAQFGHVPSDTELHDALQLPLIQHIVITLDAWPEDYGRLTSLGNLPEEADAIVVLRGYPPTRAAAEAWNYLSAPIRMVLVVAGPPPAGVINDLNQMRHLERVIAEMDDPARTGFERLQRPLSFRKLID
jgi:hypothetical protein